jgi:hypothetical protein
LRAYEKKTILDEVVFFFMIDRQYSPYCFLASELSIEKKIKYYRQAAYSQSMGFAINICIHNSDPPPQKISTPFGSNYFTSF